jgi:hypothetical protein
MERKWLELLDGHPELVIVTKGVEASGPGGDDGEDLGSQRSSGREMSWGVDSAVVVPLSQPRPGVRQKIGGRDLMKALGKYSQEAGLAGLLAFSGILWFGRVVALAAT